MTEAKRILHIVGEMTAGGIQAMIMNLYRHMDRNKYQFDFVVHTTMECTYDQEIMRLGGRIYRLPVASEVGIMKYSRLFNKLLLQAKPIHGIHSHVAFFSGLIMKLAYKANIQKRISHIHNTRMDRKGTILRRLYYRYMKFMIMTYSTNLLGCSISAFKFLYGNYYEKDDRIKLIKNAIELDLYNRSSEDKAHTRKLLFLPDDSLVIGHVGRFDNQKNHKYIIEIFHDLIKSGVDAHLILVGDGKLKPEIEKMVEARRMTSVIHFLGNRRDVPDLLRAMDVIVFPSLFEGLPLTLVEAQASGTPIVTSNNITTEVDMGLELIKFLSLEAEVKSWTQEIIASSRLNKLEWQQRYKALYEHGYDVKKSVEQIMEVYD